MDIVVLEGFGIHELLISSLPKKVQKRAQGAPLELQRYRLSLRAMLK
jgi:hypothetical protein